MATYKVLQDIEAEDKLLGPLTLRQFIYGAIAALAGYFCFIGIVKHVYPVTVIFLPVVGLFGFFAFPWGRDQPTEIWALARIRFLFLPRRRLWDQSGAKELVTVTAPKKTDNNYTNGLSQTEVKSRLKALADTIDSRGWAIKNIDPASVTTYRANAPQSDRLVDLASLPQEVATVNLQSADDILDEASVTANHFDQMINAAASSHRAQLMQTAAGLAPSTGAPANSNSPDNFWFLNQSPKDGMVDASVITPGSKSSGENFAADDKALAERLKANKKAPELYSPHLRTIQPTRQTPPRPAAANSANTKVAAAPKANDNESGNAKIEQSGHTAEQAWLAQNNDRSIASIAREVNKNDEVVINLH